MLEGWECGVHMYMGAWDIQEYWGTLGTQTLGVVSKSGRPGRVPERKSAGQMG